MEGKKIDVKGEGRHLKEIEKQLKTGREKQMRERGRGGSNN